MYVKHELKFSYNTQGLRHVLSQKLNCRCSTPKKQYTSTLTFQLIVCCESTAEIFALPVCAYRRKYQQIMGIWNPNAIQS